MIDHFSLSIACATLNFAKTVLYLGVCVAPALTRGKPTRRSNSTSSRTKPTTARCNAATSTLLEDRPSARCQLEESCYRSILVPQDGEQGRGKVTAVGDEPSTGAHEHYPYTRITSRRKKGKIKRTWSWRRGLGVMGPVPETREGQTRDTRHFTAGPLLYTLSLSRLSPLSFISLSSRPSALPPLPLIFPKSNNRFIYGK